MTSRAHACFTLARTSLLNNKRRYYRQQTSLLQTTTMDAEVLLSAIFRDSTKDGRSQFVKIWFLPAKLPAWLLPDLRIYPITKGVVSFTFRRLPPRDLTIAINMENKRYQYLGGCGKAALKTLLKKAVDDPGYSIHGHLVIVPLDEPSAETVDRLMKAGEIATKSNIEDDTQDGTPPSYCTKNSTGKMNERSPYRMESLDRYDRVPGPFTVDNIIPRCGLIKESNTIIPFAKVLGCPELKPSMELASIKRSMEIKTELDQPTDNKMRTSAMTTDTKKTTKPSLKHSMTQNVLSWFARGFSFLKDAVI